MENFSSRLIRLRKSHGLSQEQLGNKIGLKKSAIYKMEKGLTVNPKRSTVEKLATIFNVSGSYILCMTDNEQTNVESITPKEFETEVKNLLSKVNDLNEQQKNHIISTLEFICDDK